MKKILAFILSPVHYVIFLSLLLLFHPIQIVAFNFFGYSAHKKTVDILNYLLILNFYTIFCRPSFRGFNKLPGNKPLIIVSNHQSLYDIPPVVWGFRKHHVKFIAKKELRRFFPSISYNLRKGGSVLIDRKSGSQSIKDIFRLGKFIEQHKYSVCIFPEGTRNASGSVREFHDAGFKTLMKASPSALIVPFVIRGNHFLHKYGFFPLNIGLNLNYIVLDPIQRNAFPDEDILELVRNRIKDALK